MAIHNTEEKYGSVHKALHWVIALLMIGMLAVGLWMEGLEKTPFRIQVYSWHKATGIIVLMLVTLRLLWRLTQKMPLLPAHMPEWQKQVAEGVHALLYIMLFAMPLTGWAMTNSAGFQVSFFGLFTVPEIIGPDPQWRPVFRELHGVFGYLAIGLIAMHVAAALWHHAVVKDNVLQRMLPWGKLK